MSNWGGISREPAPGELAEPLLVVRAWQWVYYRSGLAGRVAVRRQARQDAALLSEAGTSTAVKIH